MRMTDRDLDDAIDRAVRDMMSVDGSSVTGARVVASVERSARRLTLWMWTAAAATAALILAVIVMRGPRHETSPDIAAAPARGSLPVLPPAERAPVPSEFAE